MLNSLNYFRAIAITIIVAGHFYPVLGINHESFLNRTMINLITGGTALFVFISGFLFHHVFIKTYKFDFFIIKKIKKIFIPYFILGILPVFYLVWTGANYYGDYFLADGEGVLTSFIFPVSKYYLTGRFLTAYWYIPFIILVFLMSPAHVKYAKLNLSLQILIIVILSFVSILIHRPTGNLLPFQNLIYFTPIYLIGITVSIHKDYIYKKLQGKEFYLLAITISLAVIQASLGYTGSYHKSMLTYAGIDIMFFQKIVMCFFFLIWLKKYENVEVRTLNLLASTSFAIFFIHPIIISIVYKSQVSFSGSDSFLFLVLITLLVLFFCVVFALILRYLIPKHSRYIIGY
ncbi:acyltransferase [Pseudoalteromonas sp. R86517]|uniref:acyltransferase family protein n=1 Tax=Pseudoalteromonas sp. R86517 TaxID=3093857 RepID=UPI003671FB38